MTDAVRYRIAAFYVYWLIEWNFGAVTSPNACLAYHDLVVLVDLEQLDIVFLAVCRAISGLFCGDAPAYSFAVVCSSESCCMTMGEA